MLVLARRHSGESGRGRGDALGRRTRWLLVPLALSLGSLGGCAGGWDELTSRDFHFKDAFKKAPDPMWVIENSPDGDKKARALRSLKEPAQHGGTPEEQDKVVRLLVWTAANDPQAVCRLAAIDTLRHFRDPRAVEGLKDAYYRADGLAAPARVSRDLMTQQGGFPQDTVSIIRAVVLTALGDAAAGQDARSQASAVELLVNALVTAPDEKNAAALQQSQDERTAAARALGHFPQYQSTEALVKVLRSTPDVALRNRAGEALAKITGKDLPPDAQAWDDFLHKSPQQQGAVAGTGNVFDNFLRHISGPAEHAEPR